VAIPEDPKNRHWDPNKGTNGESHPSTVVIIAGVIVPGVRRRSSSKDNR
jgi:hypothetical protein